MYGGKRCDYDTGQRKRVEALEVLGLINDCEVWESLKGYNARPQMQDQAMV